MIKTGLKELSIKPSEEFIFIQSTDLPFKQRPQEVPGPWETQMSPSDPEHGGVMDTRLPQGERLLGRASGLGALDRWRSRQGLQAEGTKPSFNRDRTARVRSQLTSSLLCSHSGGNFPLESCEPQQRHLRS